MVAKNRTAALPPGAHGGPGSEPVLRLEGTLRLVNEHNAPVPRDFRLERWEVRAVLQCHAQYPLEGCRRLCFMMLDRDIVAVSPASVYRVLRKAGLVGKTLQPFAQGWRLCTTAGTP